jgi:DNA-3-methyladenine glycosylase II
MKELLQKDPRLQLLFETVSLPDLADNSDLYLALLEAIVSQQLSVKAADTIFNRFMGLFPEKYPHPDTLADMNMETLRSVGLSSQKSQYVRNVALFHIEKGISPQILKPKSDIEVIEYLTQIKGVGKWTVEMLLMFHLHRPDVMPVDDLGIQQGMTKLYGLTETGKDLKKRMFEISENWKPHRSLVCRYLWRWKDTA